MENAERFIACFNRIQSYLSFLSDEEEHKKPFYRLLDENENRNEAVKKNKKDLQMCADLRNVLVHKKVNPNEYPANPTDDLVQRIEKIEQEIVNRPRVYPTFKRTVVKFESHDSFKDVLKVIKERNITHFPIYEKNRFIGLLTENGITLWLAHHLQDHSLDLKEVTVEEIVKEDQKSNNYLFIRKGMPIDTAAGLLKNDRRLDALLISENGKKDEPPLGIITTSDL